MPYLELIYKYKLNFEGCLMNLDLIFIVSFTVPNFHVCQLQRSRVQFIYYPSTLPSLEMLQKDLASTGVWRNTVLLFVRWIYPALDKVNYSDTLNFY